MPVLHTKTGRMWLPDALRGLALLNMLAYHTMYDWVYVFGHESSWYNIWAPGCHVWQQYICWSFILLSGFSFPLARKPVENGLLVAGCAALLTFVTAVFMPSESIWFGVLHLLGCAALLTCLLRPALEKLPAAIVAAQSIAVDAVSGATRSSEGVVKAVTAALEAAGADIAAFSKPVESAPVVAPDYFPVMGSFEVPTTWDESYDVVVVGGGFAGLAAAYGAVENGSSVVLVEKLSTTGGNSAINGGQYASYTSKVAAELQKKFDLVPDTAEKHIEE